MTGGATNMTIRSRANALCNEVIKSPLRDDLKALIRNTTVSYSNPPPGFVDRSQLGYYARRQRIQFLGYLLIHQARSSQQVDDQTASLPGLTAEEYALFRSAHDCLVELHRRCVRPVLERFSQCSAALNPYSEFRRLKQEPVERRELLKSVTLDRFANAFHEHVGVQVLRDADAKIVNRLTEAQCENAVIALRRELGAASLKKVPAQVDQMIHQLRRGSVERTIARYVCALLSLRQSLRVVSQMLFQAVSSDKPPIFDSDNVIAVRSAGSDVLGSSLTLVALPTPTTAHLEPSAVVVIAKLPGSERSTGVGWILQTSSGFSHEHGAADEYGIRLIDNQLDPYPGLLAHV